ncbi:hypothetical protein COLO4_16096 [Corchorus olitorius]|uniref:Uncharacterized protein n=1 Tax=Corchorus olitorius TaxID=93759 RepID=A0A1R3JJJ5_9ROSI|nr:hypothetical protein COLO4_16096 [Corchorus olitorius]
MDTIRRLWQLSDTSKLGNPFKQAEDYKQDMKMKITVQPNDQGKMLHSSKGDVIQKTQDKRLMRRIGVVIADFEIRVIIELRRLKLSIRTEWRQIWDDEGGSRRTLKRLCSWLEVKPGSSQRKERKKLVRGEEFRSRKIEQQRAKEFLAFKLRSHKTTPFHQDCGCIP